MMYSQRDMDQINGRIRRNLLALVPVAAVILAVYVYALKAGVKWLAMVAGPLLFVAACYGILAYLWPNMRYRRFLTDMERGLTREVRGTVLEIADAPEQRDGATVLPVRLRLAEDAAREGDAPHASALAERLRLEQPESGDRDEEVRILYLNASKRAGFPGPGVRVALCCSGRHIKQVLDPGDGPRQGA